MVKQSAAILSGIRAIALDGYGTVINFTEADFIVLMADICARQGLQADAGEMWQRFLVASREMRSEHHHDPEWRLYVDAWRLQFEIVFRRMRLATADAHEASVQFRQTLADAPAFEEAAPAIATLRSRYPVAMLSNADEDFLCACLARNKLEFDYVMTSERAESMKPNRGIFDKLAEEMGVPNEQVLYAGDNPIPDVLGPVNAGMKAAWVNRFGLRKPRGTPQPHIRVRSLAELAELLVPRHD